MTDDEWFANLSDDPEFPSVITIRQRGEVAVFDFDMTVMPGEELIGYRVPEGIVFTGFPNVTVH